jgi:hypothetical protein
MFGHKQIWAAFEAVAEASGMSLSALSKSAGLDPTSFNPSKRYGPGGRERWPSTETLSRVLMAANMDLRTFAEILNAQTGRESERPKPTRRRSKRLLSILEGRIRIGDQARQIPCTLRDLSATGARIWLRRAIELPGEFELEIPRLDQSLKVRLIWSRDESHGVMFLEELRHPLGEDVTHLLNAIRTPDDETYIEDATGELAPPAREAPKEEATGSDSPRSQSRKSG